MPGFSSCQIAELYSKPKQIAQTYFNVMTTLQVRKPVSRLFSPVLLRISRIECTLYNFIAIHR